MPDRQQKVQNHSTLQYSTVYTIQYVADCLLRRVHAYLPHFYTAADSVHFEQIRIRPLKKMWSSSKSTID